MPCRIFIRYGIIPAVFVQVQSVSIIGIFLYETSDHRVIVTCPEIVLTGNGIILLSLVSETVRYSFLTAYGITKHIILIMVEYSVLVFVLYG